MKQLNLAVRTLPFILTRLVKRRLSTFPPALPAQHADPALNSLLRGLDQEDATTVDLTSPVHSVRKANSIVIVNPQLMGADTNLSRMTSVAMRAQISGKPLALVGITAWTPRSWAARKMIRTLVTRSDLTLLSDEKSADVLAELGVEGPFRLGADPAWAGLASLLPVTGAEGDRAIWVSSNNLDNADRYVRRMAAIFAPLVAAGLRVQMQPALDSRAGHLTKIAGRISSLLGSDVEMLPHTQDIAAAREMYAGSRLVVATEKRSLMAAAASGAPTVAVSLSPQARRLADNLGVEALLPVQGDEAVTSAVMKAVEAEKAVDPAVVLQNIDRARASISLVRMLLSGGTEVATDAIESLPLYPQAWRA